MMRRILFVTVLSVVSVAPLVLAPEAYGQGLNCDDFPSQQAAQQKLRENPSDPEGLDGPPGPTSDGIPGVACEANPPPTDFNPVLPGEGDDKQLFEAGGDLPLPPPQVETEHVSDQPSGSWPLAPTAVILISSGILMFALYRLLGQRD